MSLAAKVHALLVSLSPADIAALAPVERRRLADLCRHVAAMADRAGEPKVGVLADLRNGHPRHT